MNHPYHMVIDLEATCSDDGSVPKHQMEIIEIGAVMVAADSLEPVSEYQSFVRPVRHPKLTPFCTSLTSIRQADVDSARGYAEVLDECRRWAFKFDGFLFGSWGDYDRHQFEHDCEQHRVSYPFSGGHLNLKVAFSEQQGLKKKFGMAEALKLAGIDLVGVHHRGIDDARNIARLLPYALGRKRIG